MRPRRDLGTTELGWAWKPNHCLDSTILKCVYLRLGTTGKSKFPLNRLRMCTSSKRSWVCACSGFAIGTMIGFYLLLIQLYPMTEFGQFLFGMRQIYTISLSWLLISTFCPSWIQANPNSHWISQECARLQNSLEFKMSCQCRILQTFLLHYASEKLELSPYQSTQEKFRY